MTTPDISLFGNTTARKNPCWSILQAADSTPDNIAIVATSERSLTYGELRESVIGFALNLMKHGVGSSSCVAIDTWESLPAVLAILAVGLTGGSWVRAVPSLWHERKVNVTHLLSPQPPIESLLTQIRWIELSEDMTRRQGNTLRRTLLPLEIWLIPTFGFLPKVPGPPDNLTSWGCPMRIMP
jgi:hypothetical protein